MTATLCAILVDKKELAWDVGLVDGLGAKAEGALPAWKNVQLQHLLTHRAGAPANLDAGGLWLRLCLSEATPRAQRELLVLGVLSAAPKSLPGEKFVYSNAGFALAGALAESTAKLDYEALMQRELFLPLGMTSAGFGPPGDGKSLDQPRGHTADGKTIPWGPRADNPAAIAPAGRVHCTISDWAKFIALHLDARNGRARLLPSESFVRMHTPAAGPGQSYAMGWVVTQRDWAGGEVLMHNGSNTMWFCVTWLAPKQDFAVLVCTNQGGPAAEAACDEASAALIEKHAQISKSAR